MSEAEPECQKCSKQFQKQLSRYWYLKRQIRKMQKSFAAIECAITHKCDHYTEFIIGECEAYRGKNDLVCNHSRK